MERKKRRNGSEAKLRALPKGGAVAEPVSRPWGLGAAVDHGDNVGSGNGAEVNGTAAATEAAAGAVQGATGANKTNRSSSIVLAAV